MAVKQVDSESEAWVKSPPRSGGVTPGQLLTALSLSYFNCKM